VALKILLQSIPNISFRQEAFSFEFSQLLNKIMGSSVLIFVAHLLVDDIN
jgi:hypothetical protein